MESSTVTVIQGCPSGRLISTPRDTGIPADHPVHTSRVRFGVWEADLGTGELRKHGVPVRLQEQPFLILSALLERPGVLVTREDLVRRLWPDGSFVDCGLNAAISPDHVQKLRYSALVSRRPAHRL